MLPFFRLIKHITQPTEAPMALGMKLSKTTLEQLFIQVDADPMAGKGHLSKRELLIDKILAHVQTLDVTPAPAVARPILSDDAVTSQ